MNGSKTPETLKVEGIIPGALGHDVVHINYLNRKPSRDEPSRPLYKPLGKGPIPPSKP